MTDARPDRDGLQLTATVAGRGLDVDLHVPDGQVVAILGPNGAGKSTLLSLVAGLLRADTGRTTLTGRVLADSDDGTWVPAHRREVVLLAQQAMLFPHLTALQNVAFGPRSRGRSRAEARATAARWLAEVDATDLADRRPAQLSGGQAQRIAVARAMAAQPRVLLLDEPMSALDVSVAPALRQLLRRVLRAERRTALLVTHDILDALALADRVLVVDGGRIVEDGPVRDVLTRPRSPFGARIAGINLVAGTSTADGLQCPDFPLTVASPLRPSGQGAVALFSPSAVAVHLVESTGSPRNHLPVTVAELEPRGETVRVRAGDGRGGPGLFADITVAAAADLDLAPGMQVWFTIKATEITLHPAATTRTGP